ncbi:MAG: SusC/RagA family TonB-linked outer membrane protein [Alistipes sp.]
MNLKIYARRLFLTVVMLLAVSGVWAQSRNVTGVVYANDGKTPMVGATVLVKGTTTGMITNVDGTYSLKISNDNNVLIFQSIGYQTQEVVVGTRTGINVTLLESTQSIDEVVVTALGLTRSEKSVGYAVSKVAGGDLSKSISNNWVNNLNGKVAGMSMSSAGTGPGGSIRVTLRGESSLNYGANQALFVVDGIPMSNNTVASGSGANYANSNAPVDFGNPIGDINPDDIENVSVLKGPAAAALYGSQAQNGVIMVTTKSGRTQKGLGVTYNGTVSFENAGFWPEFQDQYGPSAVTTSLTNREASAWGLPASMTEDGVAVRQQISRYTYGEHFDANKKRYLYMSKNWDTGEFTKLPWVYADDWFTGLFETGITWNNTVTIDGSTGKGTNARFSFTDTRNEWITPNSGYNQQTFALTVSQKISKRIQFSTKINYIRKDSENMPMSGYSQGSPMYGLIWGYNTNPMSAYRDEYMQGRYTRANFEAGNTNDPYNLTSGLIFNSLDGQNPYRTLYEELNKLDRDHLYGNVNINIEILPELTFNLRGGLDMNVDWRSQQKPKMSMNNVDGMYREKTIRQYDYTSDFLLKYNKTFWERFTLTAAVGASSTRNKYYSTTVEASRLLTEGKGMFSFANTAVALDVSPYRSNRALHSLYGFVNLAWDDTYFLDVTARNDWSSTLHHSNWSYFYPSVSASVLLDKVLKLNTPYVNMIKLRASWASVGNDTGVYSLYPDYSTSVYPGGFTLPGTSPNAMIKPEMSKSWEVGLDVKLFESRLNFDVAFYKTTTTNQIINADQSPEIGFTGLKINAGRIVNKGVELSFRATPVRGKHFAWELYGNWAINKNKLCELQDGWDPLTPLQTSTSTTIGGRVYVQSFIGQAMHQIYGKDYVRAPEGSTYVDEDGNTVSCAGMPVINNKTGYPSLTAKADQFIGQANPDWKAGFGTSVRYKGLSFSAAFTAQVGGNAYSVTNFALSYQGKLKNTLPGREDGLVVSGVNAIPNADQSVTYVKNNTITENVYTYYQSWKYVRDNTFENTFSTDFLKLKELRLDYELPKQLVVKTKFLQGVTIGIFATNVFCITDWPQFDPEAAGMVNGTDIYPGIETGTFPMTRTYGFNLKLQF